MIIAVKSSKFLSSIHRVTLNSFPSTAFAPTGRTKGGGVGVMAMKVLAVVNAVEFLTRVLFMGVVVIFVVVKISHRFVAIVVAVGEIFLRFTSRFVALVDTTEGSRHATQTYTGRGKRYTRAWPVHFWVIRTDYVTKPRESYRVVASRRELSLTNRQAPREIGVCSVRLFLIPATCGVELTTSCQDSRGLARGRKGPRKSIVNSARHDLRRLGYVCQHSSRHLATPRDSSTTAII